MATKRGKLTHWGEDEKALLWGLGRARKNEGFSWEEIAQRVSKVRRVARTAAACAAYFERELAHYDEYPPKQLHVTITAGPGGRVLSTIVTQRSLGELEEFATAPAVRSKETGHGRRNGSRNDART